MALLNASKYTNFVYKISGLSLENEGLASINGNSIATIIYTIDKLGGLIEFLRIEGEVFEQNLRLIDSSLPEIVSSLLLCKYRNNTNKLVDLIGILNKENPNNYDLRFNHEFYRHKLMQLLTDIALGLTPGKVWNGIYDANGGIIYVKSEGDLVCFHIYNKNEFQKYLLENTRLEQASQSRHEFGTVYKQDDILLLKINLQIRYV